VNGDEPRVPSSPPRSLTKAVIAGALLIVGGVLVVMAVLPKMLSRETAQPADAPGSPTSSTRRIRATLFYVSDDGAELIQVPREILFGDTPADILTGHHGGSLDEALAVFAIVNAVTSNLPNVSAVQILVEGKEVDSLAGHIDLREPINRANAWIRKGQ
jgi:hypothetical protein